MVPAVAHRSVVVMGLIERSVLHQGRPPQDVDDGYRHFDSERVRQPHRPAQPQGHRLLPSLLYGDVVRVQIGPVGTYRVSGSVVRAVRGDARWHLEKRPRLRRGAEPVPAAVHLGVASRPAPVRRHTRELRRRRSLAGARCTGRTPLRPLRRLSPAARSCSETGPGRRRRPAGRPPKCTVTVASDGVGSSLAAGMARTRLDSSTTPYSGSIPAVSRVSLTMIETPSPRRSIMYRRCRDPGTSPTGISSKHGREHFVACRLGRIHAFYRHPVGKVAGRVDLQPVP